MVRPPEILYLLLIALTSVGALKVVTRTSSVLRGQDVTIPCDITDIDDKRAITVYWSRRSLIGTDEDVYLYNSGRETIYRPGCYVVVSEILKGNAAIHIPDAKFSDDGEYTCKVLNTPNEASGTVALQVSARPSSVTLTPEDVHVELGMEKSVECEVANFYPQNLTIRWEQYNSDSSGFVPLKRGTCTSDAIINNDGTFNITSHLTLKPSKEHNGNKYACVVIHRSLEHKIVKYFTLVVKDKEDNTGAIVGAIIGTLICTLLTVFCVLVYLKRFKKDPPILSAITGNDKLIDMSRATLTCQVMGYRPADIEISVRLRRSGGGKTTIYTWKYSDSKPPASGTRDGAGGGHVAIDMEEQHGLMNGAARQEEEGRPLQLEMVPIVSKKRLGTFSCQCSLHITPRYDTDNGAEISVYVTHSALTLPISEERVLNVIGVAPKLLSIMTPKYVTHDEPVTLTCPITGFKPQKLSITWLRKVGDRQETELINWISGTRHTHNEKYSHHLKEMEHEDKSYSCQSALTMRPTVMEDNSVTYICRTEHPATQHRGEQELKMAVTAVPVLDDIQKSPEVILVGETLDLSCRIHSFYPETIQVTWHTEDGNSLPPITSDPLLEPKSGLYHVTSKTSYIPTIRDVGKTFRCEVKHKSLTKPKPITWTLKDIISRPHVEKIWCDPAEPEIGKPVTFSCTITDMYPGFYTAQFYKGTNKLSDTNDNIQQESQSGMFSGTTELTLTPTTEDQGADIFLMITHCGETIKVNSTMHLKGLPILSDITSDPSIGDYGKLLTLRCDVTGCNPRDITKVTWTDSRKQPVKGKQSMEQGSGDSLSYMLTITPTAEDYGKACNFCIYYKDMPGTVKKSISLKLPEKTPALSDIIVRPVTLRADQKTSFQVTISGFSPRDIQVKWYKGFNPFPSKDVTSSDLQIGEDHLYTVTSTLTYTPKLADDNTDIQCEVTHAKVTRTKRYTLSLTGLRNNVERDSGTTSKKKAIFTIRRIECLTERPRVGEEVTLVGHVDGCFAEQPVFSWYKGYYPVEEHIVNQQHGTGYTSTVTFTVEDSDTDCTIRLEVTYDHHIIEETYVLRLVEI